MRPTADARPVRSARTRKRMGSGRSAARRSSGASSMGAAFSRDRSGCLRRGRRWRQEEGFPEGSGLRGASSRRGRARRARGPRRGRPCTRRRTRGRSSGRCRSAPRRRARRRGADRRRRGAGRGCACDRATTSPGKEGSGTRPRDERGKVNAAEEKREAERCARSAPPGARVDRGKEAWGAVPTEPVKAQRRTGQKPRHWLLTIASARPMQDMPALVWRPRSPLVSFQISSM